MEFVISGTSGTCVIFFGLIQNFQELMQKITPAVKFSLFGLEFSQNNLSEFVFE